MSKQRLAATMVTTLVCALGSGTALASGDEGSPKVYALIQGDIDNNMPFLAPTNDTRATLLLLLADAGLARAHMPRPIDAATKPDPNGAQTPLDLDTFAAVFDDRPPPPADASGDDSGDAVDSSDFVDGQGDLCRSNASGSDAYLSALKSSATPKAEQAVLAAARTALLSACTTPATLPAGAIRSAQGKEFAAYLNAAGAFYANDFAGARPGFAGLVNSSQPWLREASRYMIARVDLNAAPSGAFGEFGDLNLQNVDRGDLANADTEFNGYLHDYPHGRYAVSAMGLLRRVAWLSGDHVKLSDAYAQAFNAPPAMRNVSALALAYEADNKLLSTATLPELHEPRLLATLDLTGMRRLDGKPAGLSRVALESQRATFKGQEDLYAYLLAAYAFYDEDNPAAALKLVGDTPAAPHMSYVQFSVQVLKGLALESIHDRAGARKQWLTLIPLAEPVLQRPAIELALAQNYERAGDIAAVFGPGSPVHNPTYRETLLAYSAGPDLLRQRAKASDTVAHERQLATYALLFKELTRGQYAAFGGDLGLLPHNLPTDEVWDKLGIGTDTAPALNDFNWAGGTDDGFACPSIQAVAATLAKSPHAERSLMCLGEFLRIDNYDGFLLGTMPTAESGVPSQIVELGTLPSQFPGVGISRLDIYKTIIADTKAEPDVRAYALYRAVNCWAPSGYNSCDSSDAPQSQRKAWFNQLKSRYGGTTWAAKLKYYW